MQPAPGSAEVLERYKLQLGTAATNPADLRLSV